MSAGSPLVFRPSFAQRAMAMLLFAGSWLVGVRALAQIMERLPVLRASLKVAEAGAAVHVQVIFPGQRVDVIDVMSFDQDAKIASMRTY